MSREAVVHKLQRRPMKEVSTKRVLIKRATQAGKSQRPQRSAVIQRSTVIERPAVIYGSATTNESDSNQKPSLVERPSPEKHPLPVQRSAASQKSPPTQRSATRQKSPPAQRSPTQQKSPPAQRSPTQQKSPPAQRSATQQKSPPAQRSATLRGSETVPKSALKRVAPARDTVVPKKRSSPAITENDASKAIKIEEDKKDEVDEKSHSEKQYELSSRLSHALELELQRIMIKVWHEFPDNPSTAEEKLVADKFRNEAGDSLRNVIGLNVTQRLLDVHNSLYVKLNFKNQPERGTLTNFIRKYNMKTFKRIDNATNMFAAQLATFEDFDRICHETEIYCGRVKVTVKPCYSFTSCPSNLKTIYTGTAVKEHNDTEAKSGVEEKKVTSTKQTAETAREVKKDTDATVKDKKPKNEGKVESVKDKPAPVVATKASEEIVEEAKREKPKPQTVHNVTEKVPSRNIKTPAKSKEATVKKIDKKETTNIEKVRRQSINIDQMKIIDEYDNIEGEEIPEKDFDEEEELDDKDILALMAEGIVLDECGSEEE